VADVGDESAAASIEIPAAAFVPQIAPFPANDRGKIAGELPIENVALGVAMRSSDRTIPEGEDG